MLFQLILHVADLLCFILLALFIHTFSGQGSVLYAGIPVIPNGPQGGAETRHAPFDSGKHTGLKAGIKRTGLKSEITQFS